MERIHTMDGGDLRTVDESPQPDILGDGTMTEKPTASSSSPPVGSGHRGDCSDTLARAISSTLGSVLREFDSRAEGAAQSQDELSLSLDRLTGELDKLLEDAPLPFIMQQAAKITSVRKRVAALNLLLKSIQRRIDNIDRMISTGLPHGSSTEIQ